jgi:hypothetical protein
MHIKRISVVWSLFLILVLTLLAGCAAISSSSYNLTAPLSDDNVNLIFVVSPDLAYQTPGDINPDTANLTPQGLQRSLLLATYLKQQVLGAKNVTAIYTLAPMTHLQTANKYPDMTAIGYIQQFALLNQYTLPVDKSGLTYTANSFPLHAAYAKGSVPDGVAAPPSYCPNCTGWISTTLEATTIHWYPVSSKKISRVIMSFPRLGRQSAPCWPKSTANRVIT